MYKQDVITELLLNMQMIVDELEEKYNIVYFEHKNDLQILEGAEIYYGQTELSASCVYVAEAAVFEKYPVSDPEIRRISVGNVREDSGECLIAVDEGVRWQELLNSVQAIFRRYSCWWQRMMMILNNGGSLYELCVAAMDFFRNPLYVHDENFNILAMPTWVVGMGEVDMDQQTGKTTVPLKKIKEFNVNAEYIKTLSKKGAQLWNPRYGRHRDIYVNIWTRNQKYCGRFLINELNSSLKPSDFTTAEYFAGILTIAMEREMFKSENQVTFEHILKQIYTGEKLEKAYLLNRLKMVGWKQNQQYICFYMKLDKEESEIMSCRKISSTMSIVLKQSFSFIHGHKIYTLCNLTAAGYNEADCKSRLTELCEAAGVIAGASNLFGDFLQVREFYKQAEKAMEIGEKRDCRKTYFRFGEYALDYIIRHFTEELDPETVCSSSVRRLQILDREKGTDYIKTLKCYFDNNCQQTATASALFVHRSTLNYRLEKIQEISGMNLNDTDTRLLMQISIRLLEEQ